MRVSLRYRLHTGHVKTITGWHPLSSETASSGVAQVWFGGYLEDRDDGGVSGGAADALVLEGFHQLDLGEARRGSGEVLSWEGLLDPNRLARLQS